MKRSSRRILGIAAAGAFAAGVLAGTLPGPGTSVAGAEGDLGARAVILPAAPPALREAVPAVRLAASVQNGSQVAPDMPLAVHADFGEVTRVRVTGGPTPVDGVATARGWRATTPLSPGTEYVLRIHGRGPAGSDKRVVRFSTAPSSHVVGVGVTPASGSVVGIAQPIGLLFNQDVAAKRKVIEALEVSTSVPVEGAWRWVTDREVRWRPKEFWPAGTEVTLRADLRGFDLGGGAFAVRPFTTKFAIGLDQVVRVNAKSKQLQVLRNGKVVFSAPVSLGKPGYETRDGIKVVMERYREKRMISTEPGASYDVVSPFALRLTWSGEFLHAAPWNSAIGYAHTSHGCTNLTLSDAKWVFENLQQGDPVIYSGTGEPAPEIANGYGDWNVSWKAWRAA